MNIELAKPQKTLVLCLIFIIGIGCVLGGFSLYLLITSLILLCVLVFCIYKSIVSLRFAFACFAVFIFSVLYSIYRIPTSDELLSLAPKKLSLRGQVISVPRDNIPKKTKFHFKINSYKNRSEWVPVKAKTMLYIYDKERKFEEIHIGDYLELIGSVNPPFQATNPGQFDYGNFLSRKGISTMTYVRYDNWTILRDSGFGFYYLLDQLNLLRSNILAVHAKNIESPKLELLGGMVFGDRAVPVPDDVEDSFIKSGLLHLLAASGLNVGIIFGIWFFIATRLNIAYKPKIITGMVLVGIYSLLTGLPPSVTRATLMLEFILLGKLINRQADNTLLLLLVGVVMLVYNPLMIADVGFQLSFIVTLGLLMFVPILVEKTKPIPEFLSGAFIVPFVAQVFVAPIQAFYFNTFATYSLFANVIVLPFVGVISFSGFIGSIFALIPVIGEKICFLTDKIADPFLFLLLYISNFTAKMPEALQYIPKPEIIIVLIFYSLIFAIFTGFKLNFSHKKTGIIFLSLILTVLVFLFNGNLSFNKNLEFVFFDVGEGDATLIKTPERKYILVDTGPHGKYSPAKMAIVPYMRDKGIKKLDRLVLTHPDSDHTGGTVHILENIAIEKVFHNGVSNNTKTHLTITSCIEENQVKTEILADGDEIKLDKNLKIIVIRPENTDFENDNEDSLILCITYKEFSALLMADCEAESLKILQNKVKTPVDLLKVGHHGSNKSVSNAFLSYIQPAISIISAGGENKRFRHPRPNVISLLEKYNSKILRTDKDFAIKLITDGHKIKYKTFKEGDL